ncbi:actin-domain-containing protein [Lipomyces japonicus]|uniref:actin-domain-containing protein n=1 Tax=Lipomyces japonicus TaxID=56871 RepID=UPI0034CF426B
MTSKEESSEIYKGLSALRRQFSTPPSSPSSSLSGETPILSPASRQLHNDPPVILDIGARGIRAGIAGMELPACEILVQPDFRNRIQVYQLWSRNIEETNMEDFHDILQTLLRDVYYKYLLLDGKSRKVIILESAFMSIKLKQAITFVLFNYFQSISVTFLQSSICALFSAGARSGLIVDIGWHETVIVPIFDYRPLFHFVQTSNRAGKYLHDLISDEIRAVTGVQSTVPELEEFIYRSTYCDSHTSASTTTEAAPQSAFAIRLSGTDYYVPSYQTRERPIIETFIQRAADCVDDNDTFPIPDLIISILSKVGIDVRSSLMPRIIFTGGCSNIPGLKLRIVNEVRDILTGASPSLEKQKNFSPWLIRERSSIKAIQSLGAWSGASLYIQQERDYMINGNGNARRVRVETTGGVSHIASSSFRIPGEIEREKFLLDSNYATNILDWTIPVKYD